MEIIQSSLQKVSKLGFPQQALGNFLNDHACANTLLNDNFLDKKCLSLSVSKALGYLMIVAACFYKLPIILKILNLKGGDGLNIVSVYLETSSYMAAFLYNLFKNNPISTYGDLVAAIIQNFVIIGLCWKWGIDKFPFTSTHIVGVLTIVAVFIAIIFQLPSEYHSYIATYSIVVVTLSRLPQIISNFRHGKIGVQSIITLLNAVLGATAKAFITFVETHDIYLITGALFALGLNIILFGQVLYLILATPKIDTNESHGNKDKLKVEVNKGNEDVSTSHAGPYNLRKRQSTSKAN